MPSSPKSIFNLYAGLIALEKDSAETIVPTLISIFEKSSNVTLFKTELLFRSISNKTHYKCIYSKN